MVIATLATQPSHRGFDALGKLPRTLARGGPQRRTNADPNAMRARDVRARREHGMDPAESDRDNSRAAIDREPGCTALEPGHDPVS